MVCVNHWICQARFIFSASKNYDYLEWTLHTSKGGWWCSSSSAQGFHNLPAYWQPSASYQSLKTFVALWKVPPMWRIAQQCLLSRKYINVRNYKLVWIWTIWKVLFATHRTHDDNRHFPAATWQSVCGDQWQAYQLFPCRPYQGNV